MINDDAIARADELLRIGHGCTAGRAALLRVLQHLTATEVAARCSVSDGAVSFWASGRSCPSKAARRRLQEAYEIAEGDWTRSEGGTATMTQSSDRGTRREPLNQSVRIGAAVAGGSRLSSSQRAPTQSELTRQVRRLEREIDGLKETGALSRRDTERRAPTAPSEHVEALERAFAHVDARRSMVTHTATSSTFSAQRTALTKGAQGATVVTRSGKPEPTHHARSASSNSDRERLDRAFGLSSTPAVRREGNSLVLGVRNRDQ